MKNRDMRIAISGLSGVGSSTTAKLVSQQLNLPMTNFTFRDLAVERGIPWQELQVQSESDDTIDFTLDRRLIDFIVRHDRCLVATDLACWLDDRKLFGRLDLAEGPRFDYKIWLEAPLEERAKRMALRENRPVEVIMAEENQRDHNNQQRYLRLYGVDIFDHTGVDWVLNSEMLSLEETVEQIVARLQQLDVK